MKGDGAHPHARHRRGGRRPGAPLQGRVLGRARRRARALGVDRAVLRPAPHGGARRDQGLVRSEGAHEPGQDREPAEAGRPLALPLQAGLPRRGAGHACSTGARGAGCRAPWRCATTTATAASSTPARCARATASRATRRTSRAGAPTRCASRSRASSAGEGFASEAVREAFELCVSCKGCRRECPTGVDMARMKIEFLHHDRAAQRLQRARPAGGHAAGLRAVGFAVRAARERRAAPAGRLARPARAHGLRRAPPAAGLQRASLARRASRRTSPADGREVVLFADTFNNWFEPAQPRRGPARAWRPPASRSCRRAATDSRPLCCGRTYLSAGMVDRAKAESRRMIDALAPWIERGVPVVGLEPSCLYSLKDEFLAMHPGRLARGRACRAGRHLRELRREGRARRREASPGGEGAPPEFLVHGHCHQKAFGAFDDTLAALRAVPGARVTRRRVELLRHGRLLRPRALRRLDGDGRGLAAAGRARREPGNDGRRGRDELPPPDRPRRLARGRASRRGPRGRARAMSAAAGHASSRRCATRSPSSRWARRRPTSRSARARSTGRPVRVALVENRIASGSIGKAEVAKLGAAASRSPRARSRPWSSTSIRPARASPRGSRRSARFGASSARRSRHAWRARRIAVVLGPQLLRRRQHARARRARGGSSARERSSRCRGRRSSPRRRAPTRWTRCSAPSPRPRSARRARAKAMRRQRGVVAGHGPGRPGCARRWSPTPAPGTRFHERHQALRERLEKGLTTRQPETLRRKELERLFAEGYEATECDGVITGTARARRGSRSRCWASSARRHVGRRACLALRAGGLAPRHRVARARRDPPRLRIARGEARGREGGAHRNSSSTWARRWRALAARGTHVELTILDRAGGGVYVALAAPATRVAVGLRGRHPGPAGRGRGEHTGSQPRRGGRHLRVPARRRGRRGAQAGPAALTTQP